MWPQFYPPGSLSLRSVFVQCTESRSIGSLQRLEIALIMNEGDSAYSPPEDPKSLPAESEYKDMSSYCGLTRAISKTLISSRCPFVQTRVRMEGI